MANRVRWIALPASLFVLIVLTGHGYPQNPPLPPPPDLTPPIPPPSPPVAPTPKTVDELIVQLEQIKKERAELEKREVAVVGQLQVRLKDQNERLLKLGITAKVTPPPPPMIDIDVDPIAPQLPK